MDEKWLKKSLSDSEDPGMSHAGLWRTGVPVSPAQWCSAWGMGQGGNDRQICSAWGLPPGAVARARRTWKEEEVL